VTPVMKWNPPESMGIGTAGDRGIYGSDRRGIHTLRCSSAHVAKFVAPSQSDMAARPTAFFSVSLSGGGPGQSGGRATLPGKFSPSDTLATGADASFAGALQYSKYGVFKRRLMRMIVGFAGGDTDMSRDYEYTDWAAVDRFAESFAKARVGRVSRAILQVEGHVSILPHNKSR